MVYFLKKCKKEFIEFSVVSFLGALSVVLMAYIINLLVKVITEGKIENLYLVSAISFVYILIDAYLDYAVDVVNEKLTQELMYHIREELLLAIERKTLFEFEKEKRNYFLNVYMNDLEIIENDYIKELLSMYNDIWVFVFGLISSLVISPLFSIIMIVLSSLPFALPYLSKRILGEKKLELSEKNEAFLRDLTELLDAFTVIKVYNRFSFFNLKITDKSRAVAKIKVQVTHTNKLVYAISYGLRMFVNIFSWVVGGFFVLQHSITLAVFFTVKQLAQYVAYPIQSFGASYTEVMAAKSVKDKVLSMIHTTGSSVFYDLPCIQKIALEHLTIDLNGKIILKDVVLNLEMGKKYLLVGDSGSGKSTLLRSIIGAIRVPQEQIKFGFGDGSFKDLSTVESLYSQIAYVGQDPFVFHLSLEDNVGLQSSSTHHIDQLIERFGLGDLQSQLMNGKKLESASGGEKKRIELARALYSNRPVLLMDEPTAGLDLQNRKAVEVLISTIEDKLMIYSTHLYDSKFLESFDAVLEVKNQTVTITNLK